MTVLQGLSPDLLNAADVSAYDLQALDNGGYVLTYSLGLEESFRSATVAAQTNGQVLTIPLAGRPHEFYVGGAPVNASFSLRGVTSTGAVKTVALTAVDGVISIGGAILDQFANDNRLTLQVNGLSQGQAVTVGIDTRQDVKYDLAAALDTVATSFAATTSGPTAVGVIATSEGRAEGFTIGSATFANGTGPSFVNIQITPQI
ncbi:hypothetical protein, partial [Novosphingobium sp. ERN07]|uniref:hypothetical protein n=1 Tax=Novosphingobium sp. ERN07 TaxID=2726187 RepID=UPI001980922B